MFDIIYIEKSLQKMEVSLEIAEYVEYVETFEETDLLEMKAVFIGETKRFLEKAQQLQMPVLAVLTKKDEDLFAFSYAVSSLEGITLDYLELIRCRFEKCPYKIAETTRLCIMEMDERSAVEYFTIKQTEPEYFLDCNEAGDVIALARSYIEYAYPFYGYGIWAVYETETGCLIGFAGVEAQELEEKTYLNLSYYIKETFRRRGYATECCQAIVRYMKAEFGEERLRCVINKSNRASLGVAEKIGVKIHIK